MALQLQRIWVKVTGPHQQFQQTVKDPETGQEVIEHARGETIDARMVPIPSQLTVTRDVEKALRGDVMRNAQPDHPPLPSGHRPASIVRCSDEEVDIWVRGGLHVWWAWQKALATRPSPPPERYSRQQLIEVLRSDVVGSVAAHRSRVEAVMMRFNLKPDVGWGKEFAGSLDELEGEVNQVFEAAL